MAGQWVEIKSKNPVNSFNNYGSTTFPDDHEILGIKHHKDEVIDTKDFDYLVKNFKLSLREYKIKNHSSKLSNKASNDLKRISHYKQEKRNTLNNKRDQTMEQLCRNQFIEILLDKMINVTNIISNSKDNIIFHAYTNPSFPHKLPQECAVKVYKTILPEFKQWQKYIKNDHYFKDKFNKQITKETIQKKAEKEKKILMRLKEAGISCPRVITLKKGVLVTTFIGKNKKSAPKLKDAVLTTAEYEDAFQQVNYLIYRMYTMNLVHGGISEDIILWHNKTCYITSVSRCVERSHKDVFNFLFRDFCTIYSFFSKRNKDILKYNTSRSLFFSTVQLEFDDKKLLKKLGELFKTEKVVDLYKLREICDST